MDGWTDEEIEAATVVAEEDLGVRYLDSGLVVRREGDGWKRVGRWDPPSAFAQDKDEDEEEEAKPKSGQPVGRASSLGEFTIIQIDDDLAAALLRAKDNLPDVS